MRNIDTALWADEFRELLARGFHFFDFLTAYERDSQLEVIARVVNPENKQSQLLATMIDPKLGEVTSIASTYRGAVWHERETAEMFGIYFVGLVDERPLLRRSLLGAPPMLKSTVLAARMLKPWPGQPSHRKQQPIGVAEDWLQV